MITPNPDLASIWAKIERAEKHINEFDVASKRFNDSYPYTFRHEVNHQARIVEIIVQSRASPPPELAVIVGDVIHNLRSSLDHLFCRIVRLRFPTYDCISVGLSFPIGNSSDHLKTILKKREIKKAGSAVLKVIKRLECYSGGKRADLWRIHELSKKDKHRLPIVAAAGLDRFRSKSSVQLSSVTLEPPKEFDFFAKTSDQKLRIFDVGDVAIILDQSAYVPLSEGGKVQTNITMGGKVVFNEPGVIELEPVYETLIGFVDIVKDTVQQLSLFFP